MKILRSPYLVIAVLIATLYLFLHIFFFSSNKVAYIDSGRLLNGYKPMIEARSEFDKKQATWKANIDSLTNEVQDAIKKYSKSSALGTPKEQQLSKELIGTKQKELHDYQMAINQNAGQEEQRLTQNVLSTVNAYLLRYGKKNNYKMILVAANGNIAYADADIDITDKVIEELNKEYAIPVKSK